MHRFPPTTSGDAVIVALTDEAALALCPGDAVIVETPRGLAPLVVDAVRLGVAFTDDNPPHPFEVPVIEATVAGRRLVWAVTDCLVPVETEDGAALPSDAVRAA